MSEFIKKGSKYYRNNSDNTQTEVTPTKEGYFTWIQPDGTKVRSKKRYKIQLQKEPSFMRKVSNWALARSGGTNNILGGAISIFNNIIPGNSTRYYTGRIHRPIEYSNPSKNARHGTTELETLDNSKEKNYIRASTIGDFSGFTPSNTKGRYQHHPRYSNLPAVTDRFYTDTIYAPNLARDTFYQNLNKSYIISTDSTLNGAKYDYIDDTYDARNHWITIQQNDGQPQVFLEDVFNTNKDFIDNNFLDQIIVNQTVPIEFTDDQEKLNRVPYLSNWFLNPRNISTATQDSF